MYLFRVSETKPYGLDDEYVKTTLDNDNINNLIMITINNKIWTEQELIKLIADAQDIAMCIRMDIDTIRDNDDVMDDETYTNFSNKY